MPSQAILRKLKRAEESEHDSSESNTKSNEFFKMGRPSTFVHNTDPDHRVGNYLRNKMNIIDLIPCDFTVDLDKVPETAEGLSGLVPKITYDDYMKEYRERCQLYGLDPFDGLRLYTTDDTTASDSLSNTYQENIASSIINKAGNFGRQVAHAMQSFGVNDIKKKVGEAVEKKGGETGITGMIDEAIPGNIQSAIKSAFNVAGLGHRVGLPQIWENSNYSPNLQTNIKLVSPYGHYNAVKEFIIKPLMYLLILSSARTSDKVSYFRPLTLTIDAYGHSHTPIGYISNINFKRGGNDSSFNIYKQPLTIDVSLSFEFLVKGFATLSTSATKGDDGTIDDAGKFLYSGGKSAGKTPSLPTLNNIITSLRPYEPDVPIQGYTNMSAAHNWGDESSVGEMVPPPHIGPVAEEMVPPPHIGISTQTDEQSKKTAANQSVSDTTNSINEETGNTSVVLTEDTKDTEDSVTADERFFIALSYTDTSDYHEVSESDAEELDF